MTDTDRQGTSNARPGFDESLEESVGFLLSDTARHVKRLLYQRLASHGVRNGAWFVLRALWEREGLTQRELADRLGMTPPSMLQMLRAMEADGLVRFEKDPGDRRKLRVFVTEMARQKKPQLLKIAVDSNQDILEGLSEAEVALLRMIVRQVRKNAAAQIAQRSVPGLDFSDEK